MSTLQEIRNDLPCFTCHKHVHAALIESVGALRATGAYLSLEGIEEPVFVAMEWYNRHEPREGNYVVIYEDGYASVSPAEAFENGYHATLDEDVAASCWAFRQAQEAEAAAAAQASELEADIPPLDPEDGPTEDEIAQAEQDEGWADEELPALDDEDRAELEAAEELGDVDEDGNLV